MSLPVLNTEQDKLFLVTWTSRYEQQMLNPNCAVEWAEARVSDQIFTPLAVFCPHMLVLSHYKTVNTSLLLSLIGDVSARNSRYECVEILRFHRTPWIYSQAKWCFAISAYLFSS